MSALALVIDDEPDIRELISLTLERMNIQSISAENVTEAKNALQVNNFDLCLTDMRLPDGDGLDIVEYIQQYYPQLPVAVITAYGNMELAVTALKAGAFDFVSKPVDLRILRDLVDTSLKLPKSMLVKESQRNLLGQSDAMDYLRQMISKVARSQAPVMISGESGSGKELVARMIHEQGPRADFAFVPINCGAIPAELMEAEFFGYLKGSFTGANADKKGLFETAHKGTLFLDEIADLPLSMQVKLLRAIQEKAIRQIGGNEEIPVDVRILSATHKDIQALTEAGDFRQDLLYRINVIPLRVPSLRERPEDIPILANYILQQLQQREENKNIPLSDSALENLSGYHFPGNVRELENILERAETLCESAMITVEDLALPEVQQQVQATSQVELDDYLDSVERDQIMKALEKYRWNKTKAAQSLGMTLRALRYRLKKLDLE